MNDRELAVEEIKILQGIIARQEDTRFKLKTVCATIFSALTAGFLSRTMGLDEVQYLGIAAPVLAIFYALDASYRTAEARAIRRSGEVEACLREQQSYDGPRIKSSMWTEGRTKHVFITQVLRAFITPRVYTMYAGMALCALAVSIAAR